MLYIEICMQIYMISEIYPNKRPKKSRLHPTFTPKPFIFASWKVNANIVSAYSFCGLSVLLYKVVRLTRKKHRGVSSETPRYFD